MRYILGKGIKVDKLVSYIFYNAYETKVSASDSAEQKKTLC